MIPSQKMGAGSILWTIAKGVDKWLPPSLLDDPEEFLLRTPLQKVIKESPVRTALIIRGPKGDLFLKRYKIRGLKERLKYFFAPSKAHREWVMAHLALRRGIPIPLPLAMGEARRGGVLKEAFLITQAISPSVPLIELVREGGEKNYIFRAARLIKKVHESGLFHQDLHAGNILVQKNEKNLYLIDLHRAMRVKGVSLDKRLWNLAQFFYSFRGRLSSEDKEAFLQLYDEGVDIFKEEFAKALVKIKQMEEKIYRRHMKSRTKRCLKNSSGFFTLRRGGWQIYSKRGWKFEELLEMLEKHKDILTAKKEGLIKDDRRTAITLFEFMGKRICVKEYRYKDPLLKFKELIRGSKARKGWLKGNGLVVRGVAGIAPLALLEHRKWHLPHEAFFIVDSPPGYIELDRYMIRTSHLKNRIKKRAFIEALADFMAELYRLKIAHRDLKTCNILVKEEDNKWEFGLIDMDDVQLDKALSKKKLIRELVQMNTSTPLFIDMRERMRFLIRYLKLIGRYRAKEIFSKVINGSKGRELVYVSPKGDEIMHIDWEKVCRKQ
ncbi:MAG: hypothetical protein DRG50_02480 [Deltaproteobacteria bacterium]|nr:MAG: hypothetical protein DRG50_02480 [Deltaproteobacteria bacterium]